MALLRVERVGGLVGFGGIGAHVRSLGQIETGKISDAEHQAVDALFESHSQGKTRGNPDVRDGFRYRITRTIAGKDTTIEVPEEDVPKFIAHCVKDELI